MTEYGGWNGWVWGLDREMRAVIQRVKKSSVSIDNEIIGEIGPGLLVLLGVAKGDDTGNAEYLADKNN